MTVVDYLAIAAIVLVIGAAVFYIIRAKLRGQKCIGCPDAKICSGNCSACHACFYQKENKEN